MGSITFNVSYLISVHTKEESPNIKQNTDVKHNSPEINLIQGKIQGIYYIQRLRDVRKNSSLTPVIKVEQSISADWSLSDNEMIPSQRKLIINRFFFT